MVDLYLFIEISFNGKYNIINLIAFDKSSSHVYGIQIIIVNIIFIVGCCISYTLVNCFFFYTRIFLSNTVKSIVSMNIRSGCNCCIQFSKFINHSPFCSELTLFLFLSVAQKSLTAESTTTPLICTGERYCFLFMLLLLFQNIQFRNPG